MPNNTQAGWNFDNSYSRLPETFFSKINLNPVSAPKLVVLNRTLATELGLSSGELEKDGVDVFAGNRAPEGSVPLAQAYAGHQFGYFTMLGDGRALLIGEQMTPKDERFDIQLKGSGRTPYSRGGDGRAALGPMLREHIISEAMHALNVPTTRSLAVVTTGDQVMREVPLPGAILTRVASSHIRVGTFQYASQFCKPDELRALAEYTILRHYPEIKDSENPFLDLLREVIKRQASLISKWVLIGFIHGVMNTDNMALSGETIDYGPCAFMDTYDPSTVFSSIDRRGRYAYDNQPKIAAWNLARFAETLIPLIDNTPEKAVELAQEEIAKFNDLYKENWLTGMRGKLGLFNQESEDEALFEELLGLMHKYGADYTNAFLALTFNKLDGNLFDNDEYPKWHQKWQERLNRQQQSKDQIHQLMRNSNPAVIPRNHRVEEALDSAVDNGDLTVMERLLDALTKPFAHTPDQDEYTTPPPPTSCGYKTFCGT